MKPIIKELLPMLMPIMKTIIKKKVLMHPSTWGALPFLAAPLTPQWIQLFEGSENEIYFRLGSYLVAAGFLLARKIKKT